MKEAAYYSYLGCCVYPFGTSGWALTRTSTATTAIGLWFFNFSFEYLKSRFIQKWIQPPACWDPGLYRILSPDWLSHFYLLKKSTKGLLYFRLVCGLLVFFKHSTHRNPKNDCWLFCIYGAPFGEKDCGLCPYNPWSQQVGWLEAFLYEAAQNFKVFSNIQKWNSKNKKPIAVDILF